MSLKSSPARLFGILATGVGFILIGAFFFDQAAAWLGYRPMAFCFLLHPVITVTSGLGVLLTTVGIIVWAVSMGKNEAGIGLVIGGVMLSILPTVLPHYLGVTCAP